MNPVTKVLRTLRHTSTAWNIIIDPNPRMSLGSLPNVRPGAYEYRLNLCSGIYLDQYIYDFPTCTGASNITFYLPPKPIRSEWLSIFHTNLKNEKGETVPDVLIDILEKFPTYDLETKGGSIAAIHDIRSKLSSITGIASFEEVIRDVKNQIVGLKPSDERKFFPQQ